MMIQRQTIVRSDKKILASLAILENLHDFILLPWAHVVACLFGNIQHLRRRSHSDLVSCFL